MKVFTFITLGFWLVISIFFGTGSMIYENAKEVLNNRIIEPAAPSDTVAIAGFANRKALEVDMLKEEVLKWESRLFWAQHFPSTVNLLIGSAAFCVIGTLIGLLKGRLYDNQTFTISYLLLIPLLGLLTAFVALSVSYIVPSLLVQGATSIRPLTLMLLSVIIGLFLKEFYKKVSDYFTK